MKTNAPLALILDDSPVMNLLLQRMLVAQGLQVQIHKPCADVAQLKPQPALMFVELQLEAENGFRILRKLSACCSAPLVLLTGTARSTDLHWGLRAGASAVLTRPLQPLAVRKVLQKLGFAPAGACT